MKHIKVLLAFALLLFVTMAIQAQSTRISATDIRNSCGLELPQNTVSSGQQFYTVQFLLREQLLSVGARELHGIEEFDVIRMNKNNGSAYYRYCCGRFATFQEAVAYCDKLKSATPFKDAYVVLIKDTYQIVDSSRVRVSTTATSVVPKPAVASSSTSSGSSSANKPSTGGAKLYEGEYTQGQLVGQTTGWTMYPAFTFYSIAIYEDKIEGTIYANFVRNNNGIRVYKNQFSDEYYHVDANFNITVYTTVYAGTTETYVSYLTKGRSTFNINNASNNTVTPGVNQSQPTPTYQQPAAQPKDCTICHGSGKCNTCNGKGYYTNLGLGSGTHPCPNCPNHSGRCQWCNGTGKQN